MDQAVLNLIHQKELEIAILKTGRIFNFPSDRIDRCYEDYSRQNKKNIHNKFVDSISRFNESNDYLRKLKLKISKIELVKEEIFTELEFDIQIIPRLDTELMTTDDHLYFKEPTLYIRLDLQNL
jgi:hypothetical protein